MDDPSDRGSLILEGLAAIGKLEEYAEAIDMDDVEGVRELLQAAGFDRETIAWVIHEMLDA